MMWTYISAVKLKRVVQIVAVLVLLIVRDANSEQNLHDTNLSLPVLIDIHGHGSGSGVLLTTDSALYLATAGHVLYEKGKEGEYQLIGNSSSLTAYNSGDELVKFEVNFSDLTKSENIMLDSKNDVAVVRLFRWSNAKAKPEKGTSIESLPEQKKIGAIGLDFSKGKPTSGIRYFSDVKVSNSVYVLGYPTSLSNKDVMFERDRPLLRKGIVAGKYPTQKRIILDCPIYHGNSGGPVLMEDGNKIVTIGIVTELIPLVEEWKNSIYGVSNSSITNSGYSVVIPMDFIVDLVSKFPPNP